MIEEVSVSARLLNWPSVCACCLQPADAVAGAAHTRYHGKEVVTSQTREWSVPYCRHCLAHQEAWEEVAGLRAEIEVAGSRRVVAALVLLGVWLMGGLIACILAFQARADIGVAARAGAGGGCCLFLLLLCGGMAALSWTAGAKHLARTERALRRATKEAEALMADDCACKGPAVEYLGWDGTVHTFAFRGPYCQLFRRANARKIVRR